MAMRRRKGHSVGQDPAEAQLSKEFSGLKSHSLSMQYHIETLRLDNLMLVEFIEQEAFLYLVRIKYIHDEEENHIQLMKDFLAQSETDQLPQAPDTDLPVAAYYRLVQETLQDSLPLSAQLATAIATCHKLGMDSADLDQIAQVRQVLLDRLDGIGQQMMQLMQRMTDLDDRYEVYVVRCKEHMARLPLLQKKQQQHSITVSQPIETQLAISPQKQTSSHLRTQTTQQITNPELNVAQSREEAVQPEEMRTHDYVDGEVNAVDSSEHLQRPLPPLPKLSPIRPRAEVANATNRKIAPQDQPLGKGQKTAAKKRLGSNSRRSNLTKTPNPGLAPHFSATNHQSGKTMLSMPVPLFEKSRQPLGQPMGSSRISTSAALSSKAAMNRLASQLLHIHG